MEQRNDNWLSRAWHRVKQELGIESKPSPEIKEHSNNGVASPDRTYVRPSELSKAYEDRVARSEQKVAEFGRESAEHARKHTGATIDLSTGQKDMRNNSEVKVARGYLQEERDRKHNYEMTR